MVKKWRSPTYYGERSDRIAERCYSMWCSMVNRLSNRENYSSVKLDERFNDYDFFYDWCNNQKGYNEKCVKGFYFELDKDVLGGMVYSPDNCVFIPRELNALFKRSLNKYNLPKGVQYFSDRKNPYRVYSNLEGKQYSYGYYSDLEEAEFISEQVRQRNLFLIANKYKNLIDERVFNVCTQ